MIHRLMALAPAALAGFLTVAALPASAEDIKLPPTAMLKPAVPVS